jgi:hypothetical protein
MERLKSDLPIFIVEIYLPCAVAAGLQLYSFAKGEEPESIFEFSSLFSLCLCLVLSTQLLLLVTPVTSSSAFLHHLQRDSKGEHSLYKDFRPWLSQPWRYYYPFFCIRRAVYAIVQVTLTQYPRAQGVINISHCFWVISTQFTIYTWLFVKYRKKVLKIVSVFAEIGVTVVFAAVEMFFLGLNTGQKVAVKVFVAAVIVAILVVHLIAMSYLTGRKLYAIVKKGKKSIILASPKAKG